jgi:hypothetical protein
MWPCSYGQGLPCCFSPRTARRERCVRCRLYVIARRSLAARQTQPIYDGVVRRSAHQPEFQHPNSASSKLVAERQAHQQMAAAISRQLKQFCSSALCKFQYNTTHAHTYTHTHASRNQRPSLSNRPLGTYLSPHRHELAICDALMGALTFSSLPFFYLTANGQVVLSTGPHPSVVMKPPETLELCDCLALHRLWAEEGV